MEGIVFFVSKKKHKIPVQKKKTSKEITIYKNDLESIQKKIMKSKKNQNNS